MTSPQGQSKENFPATPGEGLQFANDVREGLMNEKIQANIKRQIEGIPKGALGKGVGLISGQFLGANLANVRSQTGRKVEMRFVLGALKTVITDVSAISEGMGRPLTNQQKVQAMETGVKILSNAGKGRVK